MTQCSTVGDAAAKPELQTIRGLACLLLVIYHAVGPTADSGLRLPPTSSWHQAISLFDFVRMPLFAALAGFVYARRRVRADSFAAFWTRKSLRIIAPLLFATICTVALRRFAYGADDPWLGSLTHSYQQFWFLQALLVLFFCMSVWDASAKPGIVPLAIAAVTLALLAKMPAPTMLSLHGSLYLAPYFLFGIILWEGPNLLRRADICVGAAIVGPGVVLLQQAGLAGITVIVERSDLLAIICGAAFIVIAMRFMPRHHLLATLGRYSFVVFLWHSAAGAATRALFSHVDMPVLLRLMPIVLASILVPIAVFHLLKHIPLCRVLFSGEGSFSSAPNRPISSPQPATQLIPAK